MRKNRPEPRFHEVFERERITFLLDPPYSSFWRLARSRIAWQKFVTERPSFACPPISPFYVKMYEFICFWHVPKNPHGFWAVGPKTLPAHKKGALPYIVHYGSRRKAARAARTRCPLA
ncbi:hypothetical protein MPNT_130029 [Candidatus Methylacidithermus pantelleriae]|uniref:Uncharacterized protein n=1 Tax=Candidatus Methylacidithermus pantelleriae TaxID=2744239 RepID=A0A8J2BNB6_9BACT|nr:hypothetical protein MPNT_130029 [Candidatus Methylacidithermus pantelleriae]